MQTFEHMPPPWLRYPTIPQGSIGWRMGYGESYLDEYRIWKNTLTEEQKQQHQRLFPKPVCWDLSENNILQRGKFWTYNWHGTTHEKYRAAAEQGPYLFFWGHHKPEHGANKSCLSQWYDCPFRIGTLKYTCMEQYMMAKKAGLFGDTETEEKIMKTADPKEIKLLGRAVSNFDETVWDQFKYYIVLTGNYYKFSQHQPLRNFLMNTKGAVLVEASPQDSIWGIGLPATSSEAQQPSQWRGENLLGFALMEIREELGRVWGNEYYVDWNKFQ